MVVVMTNILATLIDQFSLENLKHRILRYQYV